MLQFPVWIAKSLSSTGESERANGKGQSNRKGSREGSLQSSPIRERQGVRENNGGEDIDRVSQDDISPVCASKVRAKRVSARRIHFRQESHIRKYQALDFGTRERQQRQYKRQ